MHDRLLIIGIAALILSLGGQFVVLLTNYEHRADLIQRGLAEYCATDGRFASKGECQ